MLYCQSKEESAANQSVALPSSGIIEVVLNVFAGELDCWM